MSCGFTAGAAGIGWSLGFGRIGSIVGSVLGGELIRMNGSNADIFIAVAVPAVMSALMLFLMALDSRGKTTSVAGEVTALLQSGSR